MKICRIDLESVSNKTNYNDVRLLAKKKNNRLLGIWGISMLR